MRRVEYRKSSKQFFCEGEWRESMQPGSLCNDVVAFSFQLDLPENFRVTMKCFS